MPEVVRIRSENADYQHVETLRRNREKRTRHRQAFVEGVRAIELALEHGWTVDALVYSPERGLSDWAAGIVSRSRAKRHLELTPPLLAKLSRKHDPSELLAIVGTPNDDLQRIELERDFLGVIFDRPSSPGNLGTLIRSCDALGVAGIVITGHAVDPYDPDTIAASTGSLFAVPVVRVHSPRDLERWFERLRTEFGDLHVLGTDERGSVDVDAADLCRPTVLVVGNETRGMSAHFRERCDATLRIPIGGSASSLNVACAASIVLYEAERQRRAARARGAMVGKP